jgi:hypothetical protein
MPMHNSVTCIVSNLLLINLLGKGYLKPTSYPPPRPWFAHSPGPNLSCLHSCHFLYLAHIWYPEFRSQCSRKTVGTYWPDYIASQTTFHYVHSFTSFATIILSTENQVTQLSYTFPMPLQLHLFDWWKKECANIISPHFVLKMSNT